MKIKLKFTSILVLACTLALSACSQEGGDKIVMVSSTLLTDAEAVESDTESLDVDDAYFTGVDTPANVTANFYLPLIGANGTIITWTEKTDAGNTVTLSGWGNSDAIVAWPEASGFGPYDVVLSATITKGSETATKDIQVTVYPSPTTKISTTADSVSFKMVMIPGGLTFPTGVDDEGSATVDNVYWIGETEVTYELWEKVYVWATSDTGGGTRADGGDLYYFANTGIMGDGTDDTNQHPVTTVDWRDSMVWCNALTEWYNAQKGTSFECVYTYSSAVIRDSRLTNITACDNTIASSTAQGFRLPTANEWELAARYRDGTLWTYGDHVSGDESGACSDDGSILGDMGVSTVFGDYVVWNDNSGGSAAAVKSKTANALGLYDMTGNVSEWSFDISPLESSQRVVRQSGWETSATSILRIGSWSQFDPGFYDEHTGFRFTRTQ